MSAGPSADPPARERGCALALCAACVVALLPAAALAWIGLGWLDVDWPASASAAAMVAAPLPLALGAFFARKAARSGDRRELWIGVAAALVAAALYFVMYRWGGRLLI